MAPTTLRSRVLVFALTFASYAFFHAGRKAFSAIKPVFVDTALYPPDGYLEGGGGLSQNEMLGLLDTLFLFCYSAGLYGSGWLADRAARECDLMLAVGTSLTVTPICDVVPIAKQSGARVVIVNAQETPYDYLADVVIRSGIGESLPEIVPVA